MLIAQCSVALQNVQECDATEFNRSNADWLPILYNCSIFLLSKVLKSACLILKIQLAVVDEIYQRCSIFQVEFLQNIVTVNFYGFYRDVQCIGNFFG